MTLNRFVAFLAASLFLAGPVSAQQLRFDDVIRNLRNPDPKARLSAVRLLRDAKYPESIAPMAPPYLSATAWNSAMAASARSRSVLNVFCVEPAGAGEGETIPCEVSMAFPKAV